MSYAELIKDRTSVTHLLKHVAGSIEKKIVTERYSSWIAPVDQWKVLSSYSVFDEVESEKEANSGDNTDEITTVASGAATVASSEGSSSSAPSTDGTSSSIPKELQIDSLSKLQKSILLKNGIPLETKGTSLITTSQNLSSKKVMTDLKPPDMAYPGADGIPPCPDVSEIKRAFYNRSLNIEVHDLQGYNFTSEFEQVYKGKTTAESAMEDFITICKRAFTTLDPTFNDDIGERYARMIARMCLWERSIAVEVCAKALQRSVPYLNAEMQAKEPYAPLKIFIGRDHSSSVSIGDNYIVWIRYCPRIQPRNLDRRASEEVRKAERKAHIAMQLCSYKCVQLNNASVDEFEKWCADHVENPAAKVRASRRRRYMADRERKMAGKQRKPLDSEPSSEFPAPPLPPLVFPTEETSTILESSASSQKKPAHWFLYLFCRQNFKESTNGEGSELYDDEEEEAQVWCMQSLQLEQYSQGAPGNNTSGISSNDSVASETVSVDTRETLKRRIARALASDPSPCAELVGWGHDTDYSLGVGASSRATSIHENIHLPRPIPLPVSLALERVKTIACSVRHTLVLSCLGNVYVCGENSEGALGLGDMHSRNVLTLLQWPMPPGSMDAPPKIAKIAAGSGPIGSHSMCIDNEGMLYGWGVPQAVGLGSLKPVMAPRLIDTFPRPLLGRHNEEDGDAQQINDNTNLQGTDDETAIGGPPCALKVSDVSCGGGFTVCILRESGRVCSWGVWQHGRLGQGPTPTIKAARGYGSGEKLARYKLRPAYVRGIRNAVQVSCGDAHTLCLLQDGELRAWGQNSCGQLGFGPNALGYLRDALRPAAVPPFFGSNGSSRGKNRPIARSICAGPYHSCVVDTQGGLWTFGARGAACLGHNDAYLTGDWSDRITSIFAIATNALQIMIPYELLPWVQKWSIPRKVLSLSSHSVEHVATSDQSTCVLTSDGHFLVCGTGAVCPPIVSASMEQDSRREIESQFGDAHDLDDEDFDMELEAEEENKDGKVTSEEGTSLLSRMRSRNERRKERKAALEKLRSDEHAKLIANRALLVNAFRRPSSSWLSELAGRRAINIASGGSRCFAVMDEENVAATLTSSLLRSTVRPSKSSKNYADNGDDHSTDLDTQDAASVGSYFEVRGRADCILLVSGKMILCHRAVLAARSSELRDMIAQETPTDDYSVSSAYYSQQPIQLLLPELRFDSARALLTFIYTDILPTSCIGNVSMLQSLQRVSRSLRLPRLQAICERLLDNLTQAEMARNEDMLNVDVNNDKAKNSIGALDMPIPSLARDLGTLVGEAEYADVRFIAEGRPIPAHRFILESRCDYFKAMFRFQPGIGVDGSVNQSTSSSHVSMVDVVVPDTFVAFLRLLIFIYTDTLPDGNDEALLEDLLSADRYDLSDMKSMCESMLVPSTENWLGLLKVAELVRSKRLLDQVRAYLSDNINILNERADTSDFDDNSGGDSITYLHFLRRQYPSLAEEIFEDRINLFPSPPSQLLVSKVEANHAATDAENNAPPFPIWALVLGGVAAFLYAQSATIVTLGPVVPFVNVAFLIGVLLWGYRKLFFK